MNWRDLLERRGMTAPTIPNEFACEAGKSFTPEGVRHVWYAGWRALGGASPCELWPEQRERVLAAVESMNAGDFV